MKQTLVLLKWTISCLDSNGSTTLIGFARILLEGGLEKLADPQRIYEKNWILFNFDENILPLLVQVHGQDLVKVFHN
jgi:hypothetical protein